MSTLAAPRTRERRRTEIAALGAVTRARTLVTTLGGRYSIQLQIDVDGGSDEVERWALAATLLGTAVPSRSVVAAWDALDRAGVDSILRAGERGQAELLDLVGADLPRESRRAPHRISLVAAALADRGYRRLASLGEALADPHELTCTLTALPGWGPVTVHTFLRELRGVWPGATPPLGTPATHAAEHAHLPPSLDGLDAVAAVARLDVRDVEASLWRLAGSHELSACPGGEECPFVGFDPEQLTHF